MSRRDFAKPKKWCWGIFQIGIKIKNGGALWKTMAMVAVGFTAPCGTLESNFPLCSPVWCWESTEKVVESQTKLLMLFLLKPNFKCQNLHSNWPESFVFCIVHSVSFKNLLWKTVVCKQMLISLTVSCVTTPRNWNSCVENCQKCIIAIFSDNAKALLSRIIQFTWVEPGAHP